MGTLREHAPHEFVGGEYHDTKAFALRDVRVIEVRSMVYSGGETERGVPVSEWKPWPGPHKNVLTWYVLEGGKAVGWNENPSRGWSFPVITYKSEA